MLKLKKTSILNLATFMYLLTTYLFASSSLGNIFLIMELLLIFLSDSDIRKNVRKFQFLPIYNYMFIFIIVCGISVFFARNRNLSLTMTLTMIKIFMSTYIIFSAYKEKNTVNDLLKIIMIVGYVLVII